MNAIEIQWLAAFVYFHQLKRRATFQEVDAAYARAKYYENLFLEMSYWRLAAFPFRITYIEEEMQDHLDALEASSER